MQPLKDEDSGSDSGSGSDFRRKNAVRRGSVDKDEMVRLTSPVLSGPKASVTDPDTDRYQYFQLDILYGVTLLCS